MILFLVVCGFFDTMLGLPVSTYYAFQAYGEMYALGQRVEASCELEDVYTMAATDGEKKIVIVSNYSHDTHKNLELNLDDSFSVYLIDENRYMMKTHWNPSKFQLRTNQIAVIKNY